MFPMTVTINNKAQLDAVMQALADINEYAQQKATHAEPADKKPEAAKAEKSEKKSGAAQTAPETSTTTTEVAAPTEEQAPAPTYEDVSKAVLGVAKDKGRDAAVAVLKQFGASKATELKPEQYAAVIEAARKALGGK